MSLEIFVTDTRWNYILFKLMGWLWNPSSHHRKWAEAVPWHLRLGQINTTLHDFYLQGTRP